MLLDKLEKVVCVVGGITVCGLIVLMVQMRRSIRHPAEIEVTPVDLKIESPETPGEKPSVARKAASPARPNTSSPQPPKEVTTLVVQNPVKKIMPSHTSVEDRRIDPPFREHYSRYPSVFDEMKNAEGEWVGTPYGIGVILTSIAKGSMIEKVGFAPGDIVVAINGRTLEPLAGSTVDIYKEGERLYEQLKSQELFEIEIIRNGQPTLLRYHIPMK